MYRFGQYYHVRTGHSNNSSSSHLIVLLQEPLNYADEMAEFGWQKFVAANVESKRMYVLACVLGMCKWLDRTNGTACVSYLLTHYPEIVEYQTDEWTPYVDHQSAFTIPLAYNKKDIHWGFVEKLLEYVANPNIAILGGDDNEFRFRYDFEYTIISTFKPLIDYPDVFVVKQEEDIFWFFDPKNGTRFAFSFDPVPTPSKLNTPLLTDMKITDYCPFDCPFCYQGSTRAGVHAPLGRIVDYLNQLAAMQVFEIALGGGEPTLHPDFITILQVGKALGINMNFTTKNPAWLKNEKLREQILQYATSVAISVSTVAEVTMYNELIGKDSRRFTYHLIPGVIPEYEFAQIISLTGRYTLLGYKTNGRGASVKPYTYDPLEIITNYAKYVPDIIQVDTCFAAQHWGRLSKTTKETLVHKHEGGYSWYIDAVNATCTASSFTEQSPLSIGEQSLLELWKRVPVHILE